METADPRSTPDLASIKTGSHWRQVRYSPHPKKQKLTFDEIKDAAHPMLPHQGQAGAMAIEDSAAIGKLFENFEDKSVEAISTRLDLFEKIRRNRASAMQIISSTGQEQLEKHMALVAKYLPEDQVPRKYTNHTITVF